MWFSTVFLTLVAGGNLFPSPSKWMTLGYFCSSKTRKYTNFRHPNITTYIPPLNMRKLKVTRAMYTTQRLSSHRPKARLAAMNR
jgi:hypothetical protein